MACTPSPDRVLRERMKAARAAFYRATREIDAAIRGGAAAPRQRIEAMLRAAAVLGDGHQPGGGGA